MHSDGKQARVAVMEVGDKVQVVINGARGLSRRLLNPSKIYTLDGMQARATAQETRLVVQQAANDIDQIKCS